MVTKSLLNFSMTIVRFQDLMTYVENDEKDHKIHRFGVNINFGFRGNYRKTQGYTGQRGRSPTKFQK